MSGRRLLATFEELVKKIRDRYGYIRDLAREPRVADLPRYVILSNFERDTVPLLTAERKGIEMPYNVLNVSPNSDNLTHNEKGFCRVLGDGTKGTIRRVAFRV